MSAEVKKRQKHALKEQHVNQLHKLVFKSDADVEFLEVVRDYMKMRSEAELAHSKQLEKISKTIMHKKFRKYLGASNMPLFLGPNNVIVGDAKEDGGADEKKEGQEAIVAAPPNPTALHESSQSKVYSTLHDLLVETEAQAKQRNIMAEGLHNEISDYLKDFHKQKILLTKRHVEFGVNLNF